MTLLFIKYNILSYRTKRQIRHTDEQRKKQRRRNYSFIWNRVESIDDDASDYVFIKILKDENSRKDKKCPDPPRENKNGNK